VNRLLVSDYLLGMAETAVADPVEKHKVLALLIKSYISYYLSDEHAHPSVHPDAQYDAIDDPRAFQKYVGIGRLDVMPERESIVDETIDTWITYDDAIPLLPYFSCSAGFTWSAEDKR
jgi:peptidoglycan hydrolase-like amidase